MTLSQRLMKHIMERYGGVIDLAEHPEVLDEILEEVMAYNEPDKTLAQSVSATTKPPFDISWMDSWVAHQVFSERIAEADLKNRELASVLRGMADLKFDARLQEIRQLINGLRSEPGTPDPPDAGPAPPAGPRSAIFAEPPDGGTPEPGAPLPPPPAGPLSSGLGGFAENPWILYWFISLKTPMLLDVIDLHISRRIEALRQ
jgi:hypothetical protein